MGSWVYRPDSWYYGIPNFTGLYTYFSELQEPGGITEQRKHELWAHASNVAQRSIDALQNTANIETANDFLAVVAESERAKEISMIKTFCNQTKQQFPQLQPFLDNLSSIDKDLYGFYSALTAAINEVRRGTQNYHNELLRIKQNFADASRTLQNYKADDYRYRLDGDISSFIRRITGNFRVSQEMPNAFSQQVQSLTLRILDKMGVGAQVASGEDFVAIAAATLIDVERQVQAELDTKLINGYDSRKKLDEAIDQGILNKIEQRYSDIASKASLAKSPIEIALSNINGDEFNRIIMNAKDILNIKTDNKTADQIKKLKNTISKRDARARNSNKGLAQIRQQVKQIVHSKNINLISFNIEGSAQSKHGNVYELVESIYQNGFKVSGNMATDIITYTFGWNVQQNNAALSTLSQEISKLYTEAYAELQAIPKGEIRDTRAILENMNKKIDNLIKLTEEKMREAGNLKTDDIFIFHETLKLSSSAETGRNKHGGGFTGRNMSIMSYIDTLYTMTDSIDLPLDRTGLGFLALNLVPGAVAEDKKGPLEQYLSLYTGMLMFDDVANMAQEAVSMVNTFSSGGTIKQIHLYNLNGIYVPASMMLTYLSDAVHATLADIVSGLAAKATITTKPNSAYADYLSLRKSGEKYNLSPPMWAAVAAESASNTNITINFLASFKAFIEQLT